MEYILWGISWANAQLMLEDMQRIDYKSKSGKQSTTTDTIDLSTEEGVDKLHKLFGS